MKYWSKFIYFHSRNTFENICKMLDVLSRPQCVNSMWPRHTKACHMFGAHYQVVTGTNAEIYISTQENAFENVTCKMLAILFRPQSVDSLWSAVLVARSYGVKDLDLHWVSGSGLVLDGTKPLPEPMLTSPYWGPVAFTWEQFASVCPSYYPVWWNRKLYF